jgi:hypothetical protein
MSCCRWQEQPHDVAASSGRNLGRPLTVAGALVSCGYLIGALFTLVPPAVHEGRPLWMRVLYVTISFCFLGATAGFAHLAWRLLLHGPRPRLAVLAVLYGSAAAVFLLDASLELAAIPHPALRTRSAGGRA